MVWKDWFQNPAMWIPHEKRPSEESLEKLRGCGHGGEMNQSPGEAIFVTVVSIVVLGGLAFGLNLLKASFGLTIGLVGCAALIAVSLSLAFRLEAREKTRRASEDQRARLLSDLSQE